MPQIYARLFDLLTPRERRRFLLLLGLVVLAGLADMAGVASVLPFLAVMTDPGLIRSNAILRTLHDGLGFASDMAFLMFLGGVVLATVLGGLAAKLAALYGLARFSHMRNHSISNRLLDAMIRQPYVWHLSRNSADLGKTVLHEVDRVVIEALMPAIRFIAHGVSLLCLVGLLVVVEPRIAVIAAALLGGAYCGIFLLVRRALTRLGRERTGLNAARYRIAQEALAGIKPIKARGLEAAYTGRYGAASLRLASAASAAQAMGELPRNLLEAIAFGGMIALVLGLLAAGGGDLMAVIPTLGVFGFAGLKMFPNLQQMYHAATLLRFIRPMLDSVHREVMATRPVAAVQAAGRADPLGLREALVLEDVRFTYPGAAAPALDGLSLRLPARSTLGIVGGSGAGKTTLVDVMLGLLAPDSGRMLADGAEIGPQTLARWQAGIGYVPQAIHLADTTLAGNIAFGLPEDEVDMACVERAARLAMLHDFVAAELPQGYATPVGEGGVRLSGGQRQRIGIARALYHDPEVLILDEATSALDPLTERAVMAAVRQLARTRTIVMIAHRLATVRDCDRIFLLEAGRVAASGRYEDLVEGSDGFRRLACA